MKRKIGHCVNRIGIGVALQSSNEITRENNKHGIGLSQKVSFSDWPTRRVRVREVALLKGSVNTQDFLLPGSNQPKRYSIHEYKISYGLNEYTDYNLLKRAGVSCQTVSCLCEERLREP